MPINIPNNLPAYATLVGENIFVMSQKRAEQQDIRPLRILLLNLMPKKIETETQFLRLLSNTPLQVDVDLLQTVSHVSRNTSSEHLLKFYKCFSDVRHEYYDALIITGAPVELLAFEDVDYWPELCAIMEWSRKHVFSTFHVCWGAQAGLYYHYGIPKYTLPQKLSGIYAHRVLSPSHPLLRGFDSMFMVPHSRNTEVREEDIARIPQLEILAASEEAGIHIVGDRSSRQFFLTGHAEYDLHTLAGEYTRDMTAGVSVPLPANYFPGDDPAAPPMFNWRAHASLLFSNWLNFCVYQQTPYDLSKLPLLEEVL